MSKKNKYDDDAEEILVEEKKFRQKKRKFKASCPHVKKSGKLPVEGKEHIHECSRCRTQIDLSEFVDDPQKSIRSLRSAVAEVKNGLEIIKFRSAMDGDNKRSQEIVEFAAKMIYDLDTVPDVIEAFLEDSKSKKEKKKEKAREIKVGLDSLAFGKKKKK